MTLFKSLELLLKTSQRYATTGINQHSHGKSSSFPGRYHQHGACSMANVSLPECNCQALQTQKTTVETSLSLASSIPEPAYHLQALGIQSLTETENGFMEPKYLAFEEVMKDTPGSSAENMTTDALGKSVF